MTETKTGRVVIFGTWVDPKSKGAVAIAAAQMDRADAENSPAAPPETATSRKG